MPPPIWPAPMMPIVRMSIVDSSSRQLPVPPRSIKRGLPTIRSRSSERIRAARSAPSESALLVPAGDRLLGKFPVAGTAPRHLNPLRLVAQQEMHVLGRNRQRRVDRAGIRPDTFGPAIVENVEVRA